MVLIICFLMFVWICFKEMFGLCWVDKIIVLIWIGLLFVLYFIVILVLVFGCKYLMILFLCRMVICCINLWDKISGSGMYLGVLLVVKLNINFWFLVLIWLSGFI